VALSLLVFPVKGFQGKYLCIMFYKYSLAQVYKTLHLVSQKYCWLQGDAFVSRVYLIL
jgi:hypothetical protein